MLMHGLWRRTWLGCLPDKLSADAALSAVAVLEPGDMQQLAALVPDAAAAAASSSSSAKAAAAAAAAAVNGDSSSCSSTVATDLREPPRLAAAERLVGRLVVCWEMITGAAGLSGALPHGCVCLEPLDVAASLSPGA
jgi:hypothetical protein